jgi:hypothetical protein
MFDFPMCDSGVVCRMCDPGFLTLVLSTDLAVKELNKGGKK